MSRLSLIFVGFETNTLFGALELLVVDVVQFTAAEPVAADVQPAGKVGAITPSKLSNAEQVISPATSTIKVSCTVSPPASVTLTDMVACPICPEAGVTVIVRFAP
ncbi:MAG TPA: hypothetical protein VM260_27075, partial [Pirellula sp.]|nr:hypothetical protein [Pirellula sp.]